MKKTVSVLILAAGSSSRLGRPKQLLPWKETTLLGHAIEVARATDTYPIYVVLGSQAGMIRKGITDPRIRILINTNWEKGMGASISCGIQHIVSEKEEIDGLLIMLCDQPLIHASYLNMLIDAFASSGKKIVATKYARHMGVPVIFDVSYFPLLSTLEADTGARSLMEKNKLDCLGFDAPGNNPDIDTEADYHKLLKGLGS
jgi:molybdenum cofactor cytidylyltransferase